jgi:hypothetical protein
MVPLLVLSPPVKSGKSVRRALVLSRDLADFKSRRDGAGLSSIRPFCLTLVSAHVTITTRSTIRQMFVVVFIVVVCPNFSTKIESSPSHKLAESVRCRRYQDLMVEPSPSCRSMTSVPPACATASPSHRPSFSNNGRSGQFRTPGRWLPLV